MKQRETKLKKIVTVVAEKDGLRWRKKMNEHREEVDESDILHQRPNSDTY